MVSSSYLVTQRLLSLRWRHVNYVNIVEMNENLKIHLSLLPKLVRYLSSLRLSVRKI